jgi:hypothetical membrane protein
MHHLSRRIPSLPIVLALALAGSYVLFSALAAAHFPTSYSPLHNTLSQLGNRYLNPQGFRLYLIGCALAGVFAMAFFLSLAPWKETGSRWQNRALLLVQVLGIVAGFALIMNAIFPENLLPAHHFFAGVVFNGIGAAMLVAPFAFRRRGRWDLGLTWLPILAVLAVLLMFVFASNHVMEWVPSSLFLLSSAMLGFKTRNVIIAEPARVAD